MSPSLSRLEIVAFILLQLLAPTDLRCLATGDIKDPLKRDVLKPQQEAQLMGIPPPSHPLGKVTLDAKQWDDLHIHSTPYGHCMDKTGMYLVQQLPEK